MERRTCLGSVGGVLTFDGLRKQYGATTALDGLSFEVAPGQIVGFVGRNGAGKTTAMRAALGLVTPDAGEVRWNGTVPDQATLATSFGYMPEERGLYPKMRIGDQLRFLGRASGMSRRAATEAADRWLDRLGLAERAKDPLDALSLGNQQRVQLAAAVLHDPQVLILDEPFSGLDPIGVDVMLESFTEQTKRGAVVLFSSHQLDLVERVCEAVVIIDAGAVVASGPIDELRRARAGRRLEIAGPVVSSTGWLAALAGVTEVARRNGAVVVELDAAADDQAVLDAARAAGRVERFAPVVPTLAELYREAVPR
ncbi:MAG: ATP-binding cassette domain-containing protein [Acidimicrobiia bacterium]|nr:ATP-binding cassette domain-containing protein [Acidimicrobiia bacterium]